MRAVSAGAPLAGPVSGRFRRQDAPTMPAVLCQGVGRITLFADAAQESGRFRPRRAT